MVYQPYLRSQECLPLARASIKIDNHYHMNLDASAIVDWYCYSGVVALVPLSWVVGGGRGGWRSRSRIQKEPCHSLKIRPSPRLSLIKYQVGYKQSQYETRPKTHNIRMFNRWPMSFFCTCMTIKQQTASQCQLVPKMLILPCLCIPTCIILELCQIMCLSLLLLYGFSVAKIST